MLTPADGTNRREGERLAFLRTVVKLCRPMYRSLAIAVPVMVVNRIAGLAAPLGTKVLVDEILGKHRLDLLPMFGGVLILAAAVQGGASLVLAWCVGHTQERFMVEMRAKVQSHLLSLPLLFHEKRRTGALVSSVVNDVQGLTRVFGAGLLEMGGSLIGATIAFCILAAIEPVLATAGLATIVIHTVLSHGTLRRAKKLHAVHSQVRADVMGRLNESFSGVRVVKAYAAEAHENAVFAAGAKRLMETHLDAMITSERLRAASTVIAGTGTTLILCAGAVKVVAGTMTVGGLMTFSGVLFLLIGPINYLAMLVPQLSEAMAGAERTIRILTQRPEGTDEPRTTRLTRVTGRIMFDRVSFAYRQAQPVLHNVSFEAEPGKVTAIVGRSGAGKTTIAALIASLYTPVAGRVLVDGHDLRSVMLDSYRRQLGMVLQDTFLFDGTILENVAFSRHGVSRPEIIRACELARVDEFAEPLQRGYDSVVGERGVMLSGGQRQRIAIARALLADPRVLILDEPTAGLDAYAEELLYDALSRLMVGRTTFVIAHRLARVRHADQILVVEHGQIVERGNHEELMRLGRVYAALATKSADAVATALQAS